MTSCLMCKGGMQDNAEDVQFVCSRCVSNLNRLDDGQIKALYDTCLTNGWEDKAEYLESQFDIEKDRKEEETKNGTSVERSDLGRRDSGDSGDKQLHTPNSSGEKRTAVRTARSGTSRVHRRIGKRLAKTGSDN